MTVGGVDSRLSHESVELLFATLLIQVVSIDRDGDSAVVRLADPSVSAVLRAAPRVAQQAARTGLKVLVGTTGCDGLPPSTATSPTASKAALVPKAAPPPPLVAATAPAAPVTPLSPDPGLSDPIRLIYRGRQLWDPTSVTGGSRVPGYMFFATAASETLICPTLHPTHPTPTPPLPPLSFASLCGVHEPHAARNAGLGGCTRARPAQ